MLHPDSEEFTSALEAASLMGSVHYRPAAVRAFYFSDDDALGGDFTLPKGLPVILLILGFLIILIIVVVLTPVKTTFSEMIVADGPDKAYALTSSLSTPSLLPGEDVVVICGGRSYLARVISAHLLSEPSLRFPKTASIRFLAGHPNPDDCQTVKVIRTLRLKNAF